MTRTLQAIVPASFLLCLVAALDGRVQAEDWLRFRGPGGRGTSTSTNIPTTWDTQKNITWKAELPGHGASSPIIVGEKIFLGCYSGYGLDASQPGRIESLKRHLVCLDRGSGKVLWVRDVPSPGDETNFEGFMATHGYQSSTPTSDGQRVFAFFGSGGLHVFDLDGKPLWQKKLGTRSHEWGSGGSPILMGDLLIVNDSIENYCLYGLNKKTGEQLWRTKRNLASSFSTPVLVELPDGSQELVLTILRKVVGLSPKTGEKLWECQTNHAYASGSAIVDQGTIYVVATEPRSLLAILPGGKGDVTKTHVRWKAEGVGAFITTPIAYQSHIYLFDQRGIVSCVDARSGKILYRERLRGGSARFYGSPVAADGKLFAVSRHGGAYVVAAGPKFQQLAHNSFAPDASVSNATPAISDGQLFIRSDKFLYCIGDRQK